MSEYEAKLQKYIEDNDIEAELISFNQSTRSVEEASKVVGARIEDFVKSICMISSKDELIVVIVKGENRVSIKRVAKALNIGRPRIAKPDEILKKTGYPVGGVPAFGYKATFLMDPKVLDKNKVYSGGGSKKSLIFMSTISMLDANSALVIRVRK